MLLAVFFLIFCGCTSMRRCVVVHPCFTPQI
jgi:hypothetical protein